MDTKPKILIVDDEPDILEFVSYNFKKENYQVFTASNGIEAIKIARLERPDLILLDIMMPEMDGIETCRKLREDINLQESKIIFLTARDEERSEIEGFDVGADDYITKPIRPNVLLARVKALFRRNKHEQATINLGELRINLDKRLVYKGNREFILPKKEFELLALMASKPGRVFTRADLFSKIWGNDAYVGDRTLDVHIRKLREKIGEDYIRTTKGVGYSVPLLD